MKKLILGLFVSFFFLSCSDKTENITEVERATYYWKSASPHPGEIKKLVQDHKITTVYAKYFEVGYNDVQGNYPFSKTSLTSTELSQNTNIIPTVFIKNEIFKYNSNKQLDQLADNIVFLISKYNREKFEGIKEFEEIQIDCDWTKSTQVKYFYFLTKIKELSQKKISCTLRLYPFAYPDVMGIPPVDKATLMCYNLIKPLSDPDKNSILDIQELKKYLKKDKKYPLHLDIALPIFHWAHWYQNNQFIGLVNLNEKEISSFSKQLSDPNKLMWYEITEDKFINYETYLRKGDVLKCEQIHPKTMLMAISLLKEHIDFNETITVSLFDIQQKQFNQYTHEEISTFYDTFTE